MASSLYVTTPPERTQRVPSGLSVTDLLLICMALVWGLNFIVVKFATGVFAPLAFNSTRILLAVVVLWAIFLGRRLPLPSRRDMLVMLALGMLGNGLYQILFVEGLARTRASDAALLAAASPAFIEIIGWVRGHERAGVRGMSGIALSLAGIGLVVTGASHGAIGPSTLVGGPTGRAVMIRPVRVTADSVSPARRPVSGLRKTEETDQQSTEPRMS